jgi:uncharacterized protein (TIGR02145 family)
MKKKFYLFLFFGAALIFPALSQASAIVLSSESPNRIIASGSDVRVFGTAAANQVTLESGARAELIYFPGSNVINVQSDAALFTVSRSGQVVTFQGSDGTWLKVPATRDVQTIVFDGPTSLTLHIHDDRVMLDDQVIDTMPAPISDDVSNVCGAYVAPGVWKQFDCYNLAAIGKTTNDDPFTPSWRLIGGYWQWGWKGPEHSLWYNTNTLHFAHGPTGPGVSEANKDSISGWHGSNAPDGAWSDSQKTTNDPCPAGFRVPTKAQWQGVLDNNSQNTVGTWSYSATNYSAARFFGSDLMLPAAGLRSYTSGALCYRGYDSYYWSSSGHPGNHTAWYLYFLSLDAGIYNFYLSYGASVRCVAE